MTHRAYISRYEQGFFEADATFRPIAAGILNQTGLSWVSIDGSLNELVKTDGFALVIADPPDAVHAQLVAAVGVTYIPFIDSGGNPVPLDTGTIGDVAAANRAVISTALENRHIPTDDFTLATPLRTVLKKVMQRWCLRQITGIDDFTELLDLTVSSIPVQKRANFAAKLQARGLDTSGITGGMTIRQALRLLMDQLPNLKLSISEFVLE